MTIVTYLSIKIHKNTTLLKIYVKLGGWMQIIMAFYAADLQQHAPANKEGNYLLIPSCFLFQLKL